MSKTLPDLFDGCYEGEHRKAMTPEEFTQTFCSACMNAGCRNSRGAGMKWTQRMLTQEDRLLNNPDFAPENTAAILGLPDFPDMLREALAIEISNQRGDWEPVTQADVGRAAAEMMGVVPPSSPAGFQPEPEPEALEPPDSDPSDPTTVTPEKISKPGNDQAPQEPAAPLTDGTWRVQGDTPDAKGKRLIYDVILHKDGSWECSCPSRENPCKHARDIAVKRARAADMMPTNPAPNPTRPERKAPPPPRPSFNTNMPSGGVMVGGGELPPAEPDPWAAPTAPKERVIGVGGKVTFGTGKKK
jgi:hypothetical protein